MARFATNYLDGVMRLLSRIRDEEQAPLAAAADILTNAICEGRRIFAFGCTHSSIPIQDLVYRAGGLAVINPVFGPGIASLDIRPASLSTHMERLPGYASVLLDHTPIQAEDALIVVSVSGRNQVPIEIAEIAQRRRVKVIAVTSRAYSDAVDSRHPSGKRMYEFADVVLDNKVEVGDALLEDRDSPRRFSPASGVTSTALLQALVAATIERLLQRDVTPPVLQAANVEGGEEYNRQVLADNADRIFYL